jgi:hypothetical protein
MIPSPVTVEPAQHSRRAALCNSGALALALAVGRVGAQEATPGPHGMATGAIFAQTFASANLFRTQGSGPDIAPYTLYIRDVADRTLFFAGCPEAAVGVVPTNRFIDALAAGAELTAALVAPLADINGVAAEETESVWVLDLSYWGIGEDPGELTYQGNLVPAANAEERFGVKVAPEPTWQNTGAGYFFIFGVPETIVADSAALRFKLG